MAEVVSVARDGARKTIGKLISMHSRTVMDIDDGKVFTRDGKDVTKEIRERCLREIKQCHGAMAALDQMSLGNVQKCAEMLSEIKEYIPRDH